MMNRIKGWLWFKGLKDCEAYCKDNDLSSAMNPFTHFSESYKKGWTDYVVHYSLVLKREG